MFCVGTVSLLFASFISNICLDSSASGFRLEILCNNFGNFSIGQLNCFYYYIEFDFENF
jgi:hypothetical protein